ncbi:MAG: hypothetical protein KDD42_09040 [Bdellovibrionales bacterium]|nr:hypothetical protein [Bdellovibrionales bacterium]
MSLCIANAQAAVQPAEQAKINGGGGTGNPCAAPGSGYYRGYFRIRSAQDLISMDALQPDKSVLCNDIDLIDFANTTIGSDESPFRGEFHGNGKTIKNLTITSLNQPGAGVGLFRYVEGGQFTM